MPGKSYIRGAFAVAANDLIDELATRGIRSQVGYDSNRRDRTLTVYADHRHHAAVPAEWAGFKVKVQLPVTVKGGA